MTCGHKWEVGEEAKKPKEELPLEREVMRFVEGVRYALDTELKEGLFKEKSMAKTAKNVVWQEVVAAWDRRGLLTKEEHEKLMEMRF